MDRRINTRHTIGVLTALMTQENKFICFCSVENISADGAKLRLTKEIELPKDFKIILSSKDGPRRNCSVVWQNADMVGVHFNWGEGAKPERFRSV